jgi:hypothetical protein
MSQFKRKLTSRAVAGAVLALAGTASVAQAEFDSEKLTINGFIDMSTYYQDVDTGDDATSGSDSSTGLDQVEFNLGYKFDEKLSAMLDIEYQPGGDDDGAGDVDSVNLEQGYITYGLTDGLTLKAGKFLSYSGWETEDPTGLFQYSGTGYAPLFYGYYQQGASALYSTDMIDLAVSAVNSLAGPSDFDSGRMGVETMFAIRPFEGFTYKLFISQYDDLDLINTWASYQVGGLTLAVEANKRDSDADEATGGLLMVNYGWESGWGLTGRYHAYELEDDAGDTLEDVSGITISPSYAVSDNLLIVAEVRMDTDSAGAEDVDTLSAALEALITW